MLGSWRYRIGSHPRRPLQNARVFFAMKVPKPKLAVLVYLIAMVVIHACVLWQSRQLIYKGYPDFTIYYCAGTMVRTGLGHDLYNNALQYQTQKKIAPEVLTRSDALPYNHPPFEALLFAGLSYLPYFPAFVVWDMFNVGMLVGTVFLVRSRFPNCKPIPCLYGCWRAWHFSRSSSPCSRQDSILLLLIYALALVCLKKRSDARAGVWLALGLFKPHLILPFVLLWLIRAGKRILYGFRRCQLRWPYFPLRSLGQENCSPIRDTCGTWNSQRRVAPSGHRTCRTSGG